MFGDKKEPKSVQEVLDTSFESIYWSTPITIREWLLHEDKTTREQNERIREMEEKFKEPSETLKEVEKMISDFKSTLKQRENVVSEEIKKIKEISSAVKSEVNDRYYDDVRKFEGLIPQIMENFEEFKQNVRTEFGKLVETVKSLNIEVDTIRTEEMKREKLREKRYKGFEDFTSRY
jgi:DNA repair exonuclease SbcCD ATPase subunit